MEDKYTIRNILAKFPEYEDDFENILKHTGVTGIYFFNGDSFARTHSDIRLLLKKKNVVFLRYFDKDGNIFTSGPIVNIYFTSVGNIICFTEEGKKFYVDKNISKIRVIQRPEFYIAGKNEKIKDIYAAKKMVDNKKEVYASFKEGYDTVCKTPQIIDICIPDDDSEVIFSTEKAKYMIFKGV